MDKTELLQGKIDQLKKENNQLRLLLRHDDIQLNDALRELDKYKTIAKEKATRARKGSPGHDGYIVIGSREIMDRYEHTDRDGNKTIIPVVAYRTTLSMPYPSGLGFDELRRLLEIDLIGNGYNHYLQYNGWDGLGYRLGMDRVIEGCPVDGKHPGIEESNSSMITDPVCVLYRVQFNCCKEYPEVDLYTTAPLYLWNDPYKPGKEKSIENTGTGTGSESK